MTLHLTDLLVNDREMASWLEEAVAEVIADAERLAEAGTHRAPCPAMRFDGIVDSPESCTCGWGPALRAHMDLLAGEEPHSGAAVLIEDEDHALVWCGR
jgi:hypothetical protein